MADNQVNDNPPVSPFFKGEFGERIPLYQEGCPSETGCVKKLCQNNTILQICSTEH